MDQKNTSPVVECLLNAFIPAMANIDINHSSIQAKQMNDGGLTSVSVRVMMSKPISQVIGLDPTHAAIVFDIDFNDCVWSDELGCYEWRSDNYDINIDRLTKNIFWSDDDGCLLELFTVEDSKNITQKVLTGLFSSVNPSVVRLFLDSVLEGSVNTAA